MTSSPGPIFSTCKRACCSAACCCATVTPRTRTSVAVEQNTFSVFADSFASRGSW
jgi:hypothetical protein